MSERLVIIDGKSVFYRGYYAMPNLSTKDGTPTGGVYGFAVMALEIIKRLKPDYVCVAWDKRGTNIRSRRKLYPAYKANRKPAPPDFYEQIPILHELLKSLGWPLYELDDYEADDLMGAFAEQAGQKGIESYLVTSDLDVLQLVNAHTHIYTLKKGLSSIELFNVASFEEKYGVSAHQWVDVKALKGDSSDNIPGVAGVGEKTALELIAKYETLDGVYAHLDELKPALAAKLQACRDMAYLSKELVTLMIDAPLSLDFAKAKLLDGVRPEFVAELRKLEFRNLLRQVELQYPKATEPAQGTMALETPELALATVVPLNLAALKPGVPRVAALNPEGTELWLSAEAGKVMRFSLEDGALTAVESSTDFAHAVEASSTMVSVADAEVGSGGVSGQIVADLPNLAARAAGLPARPVEATELSARAGVGGDAALPRTGRGTPSALFEHDDAAPTGPPSQSADLNEIARALSSGPLIGHNLKSVYRVLLAHSAHVSGNAGHDTRIAAFILNSLIRAHELSDLLSIDVDLEQPEQVIAAIWQLYDEQTQKFNDLPKLRELAERIDFPMIYLLAKIEHRGILLDSAQLSDMSKTFEHKITELERQIYEHAKQEFNIASPAQLATILFDKLSLPTDGVKKGKTGYSTGAAELAKLRSLHPIVDLITEYREYTKLKSTYVDVLPKLVDVHGRLHTTFTLDVAATGRLSSLNPNLQNIPTRTDMGAAIRRAFVPGEGNVFVSADYSQFELRLAAVMASDEQLIQDFNADVDIHTKTAAEIYNVPLEQVTKTMRRHAKVVNFGILYGMSPHGLAIATGMTFVEAREFIRKYFELRAPVRAYIDGTVERALQAGYVETLFGRRRPTPDLKSSNFAVREAAKRAAMNMPIQGTEADLMKMAMLKVEEGLASRGNLRHNDGAPGEDAASSGETAALGRQILQVHDSILVECPKANAAKVAELLKETMESIYSLPVKLVADISIGNNWAEL